MDYNINFFMKCENCVWYLAKPPTGKYRSVHDRRFTGWCKLLEIGTGPNSLRCGGDDFEKGKAR